MLAATRAQAPSESPRPDDRSWDNKCAGLRSSYQIAPHSSSGCARHPGLPAALQHSCCGPAVAPDGQAHPFRPVTKMISDLMAEQFAALFGSEARDRQSEALFDKCEQRAGPKRAMRDVPHSAWAQSWQIPAECDARQLPGWSRYDRN